MKRMDLWKLSLLNVFASPIRSMLTVLGIAIGIGAILAVVTLGEAGKSQVRSEMGRLGIDKVWITAAQQPLRCGDGQLLSAELKVQTAETAYANAEVAFGRRQQSAVVVGCTQAYLEMTGAQLCVGRMLYPLEWKADSRSVLMGEGLAGELNAAPGDQLYVNGMPCVVRGVLKGSEAFSRVETDHALIIPLEVLCEWMGDAIHEIMLDVPQQLTPQAVAAMAGDVMSRQNRAVETLTLQVQMEAANSVIVIFVEVLKWVAFICILVGGIGVMNILLVSVRERRREIGVMKSLGAERRQICALFLLEALTYALIGGVLGILLGMGLVAAAGASIGLRTVVRAGDCCMVFLAALMVGLFFGVAPASRAAGLKCVDALRND